MKFNGKACEIALGTYMGVTLTITGAAYFKIVMETPLHQLLSISDYCQDPNQDQITLDSGPKEIVASFISTTSAESYVLSSNGIGS